LTDFLSYAIRVFVIFVFTYFAARVLSKKAIAEMTAYEMAGIIILSTIAAEPLVTKVVTKAVFGTGLIALLVSLTSGLSLINKLTPFLEHTPTVVIQHGELDMKRLRQTSLSINQLMGMLRQKGYTNVTDVEFALLEPQGELSVIPKTANRPLQYKDLGVIKTFFDPPNDGDLTVPLIMDGSLIEQNLKHVGITREALLRQLQTMGVKDYRREVAIAQIDAQKKLYISRKA